MDPQFTGLLNMLNSPFYSALFIALAAWSLAWKGIALWKAARNNQRNWYIALLILNTFGILEIIFIFYFSKFKPHANRQNLS